MLYRGSRDGFEAESFHQACDNQGMTLTVIKSEFGNIFGGYTEAEWGSKNEYLPDTRAFLFSIDLK